MANVEVVAGIAVRGEKVLLVSHKHLRVAIPGGKKHFGETDQEALSREVWEETHLRVTSVGDEPLIVHPLSDGTVTIYAMEVGEGEHEGEDGHRAWFGYPGELCGTPSVRDFRLVVDEILRKVRESRCQD